MTIYFVLAGIVICVYLSSFFSGSEMSYSSCSRMRLESEMECLRKKRTEMEEEIVTYKDEYPSMKICADRLVQDAEKQAAQELSAAVDAAREKKTSVD